MNTAVEQLWSHAISSRTKIVYNVGYDHFQNFLLLHGIQVGNILPPISEDILIYFVAYCFNSLKLQYSTIKLYLCGIRYMYLRFNSCNPFETNDNKSLPRLSLILKSVKRIQGLHVRTRLPITFDILEKICYKLRTGVFGNFVDILIECVCIVAFFGFLRCSEFSVLSSDKFYNASNLCTSDVSFY